MKVWKIKLTALSPFLIGAHRLADNHYETLDYIPGHVLQAAFAKAILMTNSRYDADAYEKKYFIDEEVIRQCKDGSRKEWENWLLAFPKLSFSDANPMGALPYTPTTFACKIKGDEHPLVETLPPRYEIKIANNPTKKIENFHCPKCQSRIERKDSWNYPQGAQLYKRLIHRVEINDHRLVAEDEKLYSLAVGEPYSYINLETGETKPFYFEAYCYSEDDADLTISREQNIEIYVGAYTTTGLGKMLVEVSPAEMDEKGPLDSLDAWQSQPGEISVAKRPFQNTMAVQLLSNVPLEIEMPPKKNYITVDEQLQLYTEWLRQKSSLPKGILVDFAFFQFLLPRSYVPGENVRESALKPHIKSGSVFVVKTDDNGRLRQWAKEISCFGLPLLINGNRHHYPVKILSGS